MGTIWVFDIRPFWRIFLEVKSIILGKKCTCVGSPFEMHMRWKSIWNAHALEVHLKCTCVGSPFEMHMRWKSIWNAHALEVHLKCACVGSPFEMRMRWKSIWNAHALEVHLKCACVGSPFEMRMRWKSIWNAHALEVQLMALPSGSEGHCRGYTISSSAEPFSNRFLLPWTTKIIPAKLSRAIERARAPELPVAPNNADRAGCLSVCMSLLAPCDRHDFACPVWQAWVCLPRVTGPCLPTFGGR